MNACPLRANSNARRYTDMFPVCNFVFRANNSCITNQNLCALLVDKYELSTIELTCQEFQLLSMSCDACTQHSFHVLTECGTALELQSFDEFSDGRTRGSTMCLVHGCENRLSRFGLRMPMHAYVHLTARVNLRTSTVWEVGWGEEEGGGGGVRVVVTQFECICNRACKSSLLSQANM